MEKNVSGHRVYVPVNSFIGRFGFKITEIFINLNVNSVYRILVVTRIERAWKKSVSFAAPVPVPYGVNEIVRKIITLS